MLKVRFRHLDRKNLLLLIVSLLLCISSVEITSYFLLKHSVYHHYFDIERSSSHLHIFNRDSEILTYGIKSNYDQEFNRSEFKTKIHINNVGLREDFDYHNEDIDIAFVGDSFTFGHGVDVGERYSDLLRDYLPQKYILSLSYLNGYTTPHYYLFLKTNQIFIPKILIIGLFLDTDLESDILETDFKFDNDQNLVSAKSLIREVTKEGYHIDKRKKMGNKLRSFLSLSNTGKVILVLWGKLEGKIVDVNAKLDTIIAYHRGELNETNLLGLEYIKKTQLLLRKHDSRVIVFMIPQSFQVGSYPDRCPYQRDLCEELVKNNYLQESLGKWFEANEIEFIDPSEYFKTLEENGTRLYYYWDSHWNKEGHKAAAKLIYEYLLEHES